jgi:hypothetical protein
MCRNIRRLHNFVPPATDAEVRAFPRPSQANSVPFEEAVEEVATVTRRLVDRLVTSAPPRTREEEARRARERRLAREQTERR